MGKKIDVKSLTEKHLGRKIALTIPYDQIKGRLTDFYASLDENEHSIVVIEIDDEPYIVGRNPELELLD
jgi:hypothetical protein